ncbi:MAG: molybdopterin-synthase adenylyltransferase MoeB, partial [Lewinella sp.]|nr:molybdopterin-synthase adenylyltransferase MoeB [Lewinella sp.]
MPSLSDAERRRYARHLVLPGIGEAGQLRLRAARVLVVGAGGLGSPCLQYLAAAGVGRIGIVDPDRVSSSNLQRQVLYGESQLGQRKVDAARDRLHDLNPLIRIDTYPVAFRRDNALALIAPYDIVVDGTDNFPTRYLVNDACVLAGKTNVYGSIFRYEGQVAVFNAPLPDGRRGPNYRDLYPTPPPPGQVPNCAEGGVLGVLPGLIGSMQANEVIKLITGIGEPLIGRLALLDAATLQWQQLRFPARPDTRITALIDYEAFCGLPAREDIPALDVAAYQEMRNRGEKHLLLDVREPAEHERDHLPGLLIPLDQLMTRLEELPREETIIVYCQTGQR